MSKIPLIFTDIDGVFIPTREGGEHFRETALEHFRRLVDAVSADIVISSTRRLVYGIGYFRRIIHSRVVGVTPECGPHIPRARHREIVKSREDLGWERPWLAIDDQGELYPASCGNLILVDPEQLFCEEQIRLAMEKLASQGWNLNRQSRGAA